MPRGPDGRTVLTDPEALNGCNRPVAARWHLVPFIPDTNAIEALSRPLRKAIKTKGSFPNEDLLASSSTSRCRTPPRNGPNEELDGGAARVQDSLR